ncbi:MAG: DHHW family protein [Oscillospiraceae bacterium]|nr:DHHW family protein [Oscillospiraceae bacterium]
MKDNFTNKTEEIEIDVKIAKPVLTPEDKKERLVRRLNKANIYIFSFLLAASSAFLFCGKRPTVSDTENRKLKQFPGISVQKLLSGEFTNGLSDFYNDTVPMRKDLKNIAATIKSYAGIEMGGVKIYSVNNGSAGQKPDTPKPSVTEAAVTMPVTEAVYPHPGTEAVTAPVTEAVTTPVVYDQGEAGELSNDIMIYKNRGIPIYYEDEDNCREYASIINEYKKQMGDEVNVFNMVCPTAISFYWPEKSDIWHGDESHALGVIRDSLENVIDVNTIPVLNDHKKEHIYSRTDHHWQPRGAYYAAQTFAGAAGVPFADLSTYEENVVPGYVGTLYGFSGSAALNANPEDFVYYVPERNYTTSYYTTNYGYRYDSSLFVEAYGVSLYCTFMGGDEQIVRLETEAPNERTLFIIKDSYGNALVPFLTGSFKNIYVVDMRYFEPNIIDFMKDHEATDVLFAMNTFSATGVNYRHLYTLLSQNKKQDPAQTTAPVTEAPADPEENEAQNTDPDDRQDDDQESGQEEIQQ